MQLLLIPAAFIPMIIAVIVIRNCETYNKESWTPIVLSFLFGSLFAAGMVLCVESFISRCITDFLILSILIAPLVEECCKPLGLVFIRKRITEFEDGLIYGAVAGLGFAATENLIYGIRFWNEGLIVLISLFYLRTLGSSMLHASSTALTGYGVSRKLLGKGSWKSVLFFYGIAVGVHSLFNVFSYAALVIHQILGVVFAVIFAVLLMLFIRENIISFDLRKIQNLSLSFIHK